MVSLLHRVISHEKSANLLRLASHSVAIKLLRFETKIPDEFGDNNPLLVNPATIAFYDCVEIGSRMLHHVEEIAVGDECAFIV